MASTVPLTISVPICETKPNKHSHNGILRRNGYVEGKSWNDEYSFINPSLHLEKFILSYVRRNHERNGLT